MPNRPQQPRTMTKQSTILKTEQAQKWLSQFAMGDRRLAEDLLSALVLVSRDDFVNSLRDLILQSAQQVDGVVGLYAEQELGHRHGTPHRLFKESTRRPKRAMGRAGPPLVKPTKAYDPSIGSEGIVAQLISELCKEFPTKFSLQPGPEQIRKKKVRAFWVVTDMIGSGHRVWRYLEAAWRVRSVRSWWSGGFLRFAVLSYAGTDSGEKTVLRHPCKPEVFQVMAAPTIHSAFTQFKAQQMERLCETYDPSIEDEDTASWQFGGAPLGYDGTGALLVFAHGAPNNVPLIFHKASRSRTRPWVPLFPSRVTASIDRRAYGVGLTREKLEKRLASLGQAKLAKSRVVHSNIPTMEISLLLSALSRPPRLRDEVLSRRTGMQIPTISRLCQLMTEYGWIDSQRRLTDEGAAQLRHARKTTMTVSKEPFPLERTIEKPYYPTSLRQPV